VFWSFWMLEVLLQEEHNKMASSTVGPFFLGTESLRVLFGCRGVLRSALCPVFVCACCGVAVVVEYHKVVRDFKRVDFRPEGPKALLH
jgi:hypothetical protein